MNNYTTQTTDILLEQSLMAEQWLKAQEVANQFGVNIRTIQRWVKEGKLVGYKIGRTLKFRPSDIEKYLELVKTGSFDKLTKNT